MCFSPHLHKREHLPPAESRTSYIELLTLLPTVMAKATKQTRDKAAGKEMEGQAVTLVAFLPGEENSTNQKPLVFCF